jgi:hypothetical protein
MCVISLCNFYRPDKILRNQDIRLLKGKKGKVIPVTGRESQ